MAPEGADVQRDLDVLADVPQMGPIDERPEPAVPVERPEVEEHLRRLRFFTEPRGERTADTYRAVVEALDREELTAEEGNDLGCGWAWRAHLEHVDEYWSQAFASLGRAVEAAARGAEREHIEGNLRTAAEAWQAFTRSS